MKLAMPLDLELFFGQHQQAVSSYLGVLNASYAENEPLGTILFNALLPSTIK